MNESKGNQDVSKKTQGNFEVMKKELKELRDKLDFKIAETAANIAENARKIEYQEQVMISLKKNFTTLQHTTKAQVA